ncbi:MAG: hypothetical protein CH6_1019 [Candidatus Kapaibacterium sp.]|nr:MAG: hypothetical protein CH6_1019 [Candidatus Kapabacteria bacterium]
MTYLVGLEPTYKELKRFSFSVPTIPPKRLEPTYKELKRAFSSEFLKIIRD